MQTAVPLSARGLEALPSAEARAIGVCHAAPGAAAPPAESMGGWLPETVQAALIHSRPVHGAAVHFSEKGERPGEGQPEGRAAEESAEYSPGAWTGAARVDAVRVWMAEAKAAEAEAEAEVEEALAEVAEAKVQAEVGSEAGVEAGVALGNALDLLADAPLPDAFDPGGPALPPGDVDAPTLRIPGRVLHLYPVYGAYRASWVPNDYAPLCSIALAPHMIHDHRGKSYLSALRGVKAAAAAAEAPPAWVPFSEAADACAVCAAPFSWQSTCRSAAQDVCAQHHCRACGKVVCGACSAHAACLPAFGIVEPTRVCDACFWKL